MQPIRVLAVCLVALFSSCAFHSTANEWNGRVGPNGKPVYLKSTSSLGFNLAIFIRLFGATNTPKLVNELTEEVADENGDHVRVIQSTSENYWYGFPPFTWIITPVINTVVADYQPTEEQLAKDQAEREADD